MTGAGIVTFDVGLSLAISERSNKKSVTSTYICPQIDSLGENSIKLSKFIGNKFQPGCRGFLPVPEIPQATEQWEIHRLQLLSNIPRGDVSHKTQHRGMQMLYCRFH